MILTRDLQGKKVRRPHWPSDEWYRLLFVGENVVLARDQNGVEITFAINYMEND